MKNNKLTQKQEAFCQAYIQTGNKSEAYRMSYNCSNMKDESIHRLSVALFNNIKVTSRINELQEKVKKIAEEKFNITTEEILRHLDILRKARIDEYVEYVEYDVPVVTSTEVGKGKSKEIVTSTTFERKTELRFKTFDKLTKEQLMCIESIKQNRYGEIELKLHGKEWSIEKINKHIGFYGKDNEQKSMNVNVSNVVQDLSNLTDEELEIMERIAKKAQQ